MLSMFGKAFGEMGTYTERQPDDAYLDRLLASSTFLAVAAFRGWARHRSIAAYVLPKFEQARSEVYIYDLAVDEEHRRQGVATALLAELRRVAFERGAYVIFVQADLEDGRPSRYTQSWACAKVSCTSIFSLARVSLERWKIPGFSAAELVR